MNGKNDEREVIVCRCMEVTEDEIRKKLKLLIKIESKSLLNQVKKLTSAGMGLCQSRTCQHLIERIIREQTGRAPSEYPPITPRPPTRPVKLINLAEAEI